MNVSECWFCAAPASRGDHLLVSLNRDVRVIPFVVGTYTRWKQASVMVPRCRRCRIGHGVTRAMDYVLIASAVITGLLLLAWGASRLGGEHWDDEWQVALPVLWTLGCLALWRGVRRNWFGSRWLAPRPERYANEYPEVKKLVAEGWGRGRAKADDHYGKPPEDIP